MHQSGNSTVGEHSGHRSSSSDIRKIAGSLAKQVKKGRFVFVFLSVKYVFLERFIDELNFHLTVEVAAGNSELGRIATDFATYGETMGAKTSEITAQNAKIVDLLERLVQIRTKKRKLNTSDDEEEKPSKNRDGASGRDTRPDDSGGPDGAAGGSAITV